ncbi:hypothetical protein acsn021_15830 [Anaerocolumna cellulosilytica]|uniref:Uncharacterized protein n=1 Tax=Anaerocolumna cellulosilytica TaxID=433286 RepID=A0A6S6QTR0_9FIRM|nr:AraC family transcriptional regulator [Anaerocolumna cellulosilytica]MBB5197205.1 AraC family transcriptional regulator of arabinose operon [Anaerocolumna cellulosilytica]BCJ94014.1 hypothetical protein acsn021_15830 [Anaerocolumna cellulosilytica]
MYIHFISLNNVHGSDFLQDRPNGRTDFTFLFAKSPSTFVINKEVFTVSAPSVILIDNFVPHKYFPNGAKYVDDYLHFAVKDRTEFLKELTYPLNKPIQVSKDSCISRTLKEIAEENSKNKYWNRITDLLIHLLMIRVAEQYDLLQQENTCLPHYEDLNSVRNLILNSPEKTWTIEELAAKAHLSQAYFQVMYKKAFGVTCITDVIQTKITCAKELLTSTDLPVKRIAQELGYSEVYHFIRQFKKSTDLTPGAFRKKVRNPEN